MRFRIAALAAAVAMAMAVALAPQARASSDPGVVMSAVYSAFCIDDPGNSTTNGTQFVLWGCNIDNQQSFEPIYVSTDSNGTKWFELQLNNGKCADGYGQTGGDPLQVWTCYGGLNQLWAVFSNLAVGNNFVDGFTWVNKHNMAIDNDHDTISGGNPIVVYHYGYGDEEQAWCGPPDLYNWYGTSVCS